MTACSSFMAYLTSLAKVVFWYLILVRFAKTTVLVGAFIQEKSLFVARVLGLSSHNTTVDLLMCRNLNAILEMTNLFAGVLEFT